MKHSTLFALIIALAFCVPGFAHATSGKFYIPEIISQVNHERAIRGLAPLKENSKLDHSAQAKAEDMDRNNYFAHISPHGTSVAGFFLAFGYHFRFAGENLASGFSTSKEVCQVWMVSPTHRANILDTDFKDIGVGFSGGYVVEHFGER